LLFPTVPFAVFFLVVLGASWAIRRSRRAQKLFLLAASYFFYGWWDVRFLGLLFASSVIDYLAGELIVRSRTRATRRAWLLASILTNLSLLGFFKYYNFFQSSMADLANLLGLEAHLPVLEVILPVGISFYTFQTLAYTFDLYLGRGVKAKSLIDFLLFVSFFPQLVAGPICRSRDLLPQLMGEAPVRIPNLPQAISLIASGLFKKMVLATFLATHLVNDAFIAPENYSAFELWIGVYAYTAMVYCDFSGYTDMARGLGLLLGFHLPENFNAPLAATDIGDFWRRWHMTYSSWLRDYIYFPLGGSKGHPLRSYLNLFITFAVGGLWHGAHLKFILWGAIHGLALAGYKASLDVRRALGVAVNRARPWWYLVLGWFATFHLCALARVFFRAPDLDAVGRYFERLLDPSVPGRGVELAVLLVASLGIGLNFFGRPLRQAFLALHDRIPRPLWPVAWTALGLILLTLRPSDPAPYIYFQF
jgi:D-alanyl-lipoteichoic acid acyltransferase DltB (MBOAT superfamily)